MMWIDAIKQFNWVDIFIAILLLRVGYVSLKSGFAVELYKLIGTITAIYLSLHYYTLLSGYLDGRVLPRNISVELINFFSFFVLSLSGYMFFKVLRDFLLRFIKMDVQPRINQWLGCILAIARGILLSSLIIFMLLIFPAGYANKSVSNSYSGKHLLQISPAAYSWLWNNVMSRFRDREVFNQNVLAVQESLQEK